jgi:hypothetical protein
MREPNAADIAATFAPYEPYGIVPDGWVDQLRRVRESCPVVHSDACGGFWLVGRHQDVATMRRDENTPLIRRDGLSRPLRELRVTFDAR